MLLGIEGIWLGLLGERRSCEYSLSRLQGKAMSQEQLQVNRLQQTVTPTLTRMTTKQDKGSVVKIVAYAAASCAIKLTV